MRFSFPGRPSAFPVAFLLALSAMILVFAGSCARPPQSDPAAARAGIEAANRDFSKGVAAHDAKALALLYTEDAKLLPPNAPPVLGRDAIAKFWESLLELPIQSLALETVEVHGTGDEVTEEGRYSLIGANGETVEVGKTLVVWRKTDAGWRLYRDMWSSDAPATAPATADTTAVPAKG
ncbi:MAG TPA: SgcJ/EcaC family oxidoreductase [Candidatus Eisenbacteria bacterium]|nr:SgcJ/EcaC family oxidoreductase [Candidatus Eisenbacteria bacterium]